MNSRRIPREQVATMSIRPLGQRVVSHERLDAQAEASRILARAEKRAGQMEEQARSMRDQAREEGRQEGRLAGERELARRLARAAGFADITAERHWPGLIDLAAQMAVRMLRRELALRPDSIRHICQEVIRENRPGSRLKVLVHPRDLKRLQAQQPLDTEPGIQVEWQTVPGIEPGGCLVQGEQGEVDARLEVQLEALVEALREAEHA